jgi:DNA repair exonuclease SbcCD ATPase subunit
MRMTEIQIEGFGRFVSRHFRLTPGFNLFFGRNEIGKSTVQQAALALLYSFTGEDGDRTAQREILEALKPWDEAAFYAGALTYTLDNGQTFRASRRFLPNPSTTLRTHPEGVDVSSRFGAASPGQLFFAQDHLGLPKEAFEDICVVRQGGPRPLRNVSAVRGGLLEVLVTGTQDASTLNAIGRLEAAITEHVGSEHDYDGPLGQALARLSSLEEERQRVLDERPVLFSRLAALDEVSARLESLSREREEVLQKQEEAERKAHPGEAAMTAEATAELRRCEAEVEKWQRWASFPVHIRDDVLRLGAQRSHFRSEGADAEQRARQAQETLRSLRKREEALQERLTSLQVVRPPSTEEISRIQSLASEWTTASELESFARERWEEAQSALEKLSQRSTEGGKSLEAAIPMGPAGLAAVQQRLRAARDRLAQAKGALREATSLWAHSGLDEAEFRRLEASVQAAEPIPGLVLEEQQEQPILSKVFGRLKRPPQEPGELASYIRLQPIYANLMRCRREADAAQQDLSDTEATILWQLGSLLGGALSDQAFAQLSERLEHYERSSSEVEQQKIAVAGLRSQLDQAGERREKARRELQADLAKLGFDSEDTQEALAAYMQSSERKGQLSQEQAEEERLRLRTEGDVELLRIRSASLQADIDQWRDRQASLSEVETQLREVLAQAGVDRRHDTLEQALEAFEQGCENHRRWERAQASLETATRYYRSLMQAREASDAALARSREARLRRGNGGYGSGPTSEMERSLDEYAMRLERLEDRLAEARAEHDRLNTALEAVGGELRHLAEIDEEIAEVRVEVEALKRFRDAAQLACTELERASQEFQKQFAPRLEFLLGDGLDRVTDGRYSEVTVDPEALTMQVLAPELGTQVPVERLSASTRSLAYLLLRISIARLMGHSRERLPLLLDEPLTEVDEDRRKRALRYLVQLAEGTQILFFTKDERIRAQFEDEWSEPSLHQVLVLN